MGEKMPMFNEIVKNIAGIKEYYRFDLIVPKKLFGRGRDFPIYAPEWELDCTWESEKTTFPVHDVDGIMMVESLNGKVRIAVLVHKDMIDLFIKDFENVIKDYDYDFEISAPLKG